MELKHFKLSLISQTVGCTAEVVTQSGSYVRQCLWAELQETGGLSAVSRLGRCRATRPLSPCRTTGLRENKTVPKPDSCLDFHLERLSGCVR